MNLIANSSGSALSVDAHGGLDEKQSEYYDEKQSEYYMEFFCNGTYAVVRKWIDSGFSDSTDTITGMLNTIRSRCLS